MWLKQKEWMKDGDGFGKQRGAMFRAHADHVEDTDVAGWILQTKAWLHGRRDRCIRHARMRRREQRANDDVVTRFTALRNVVKAAAYRCHVSGRGLMKISSKIDPKF